MLLLILALTVASAIVTWKVKTYYGLDIQGGVRVVLRAKTEEFTKQNRRWVPSENLESVRRILDNRINFQGVSEPVIITKPPDQVIVELPGLKNEKEALDRLQSTARLEFYLLPQLGNKDGTRPAIWGVRSDVDPKTGEKNEILVDNATGQPLSPERIESEIFNNTALLVVTGEDLLPNSRAVIQATNSNPVIEFEFNAKGSKAFEDATRANIGKFLAIFLDKRLLTAPSINSVIPGKGIIEGSFTLESAKALADQLNAGALPVPLEIVETRKLEATLGKEAVAATTFAGAIGLLIVLLFMLVRYRLPGLLADIALLLYTLFSIALFKLIPITLTLPGIAGFILSIGMAVDANILIFERFKEELRSGKTLRAAIDTGFKRAFTAIFDSNVCTVLTCLVLYNFGTGPIRGFALTLALGVGVSMFTAITITRTFLFTLVGMEWAQKASLYAFGSDRQYHLKVMSRKWLWLGLSVAIIIPGLIAWGMGGIKPSIDFREGTELQVPFAARHSSEDIRRALNGVNPKYADSRIVVSNDPGSAAKMAYVTTSPLNDAEREKVVSALTTQVGPLAAGQAVGYSNVSGIISRELTWNAIQAVFIASILIVLYLAVRFSIGGFVEGLKYGTCAVIALLHDVAVLWGMFAILGLLFNWQIDSLFVTAALTVVGFSVHDTIIVFDRIRENLAHRQKGQSFSDLTDLSIDQTIARSINTSLTVVITLAALFFLGGSVVHQFSGALLIGIISGTYSSIFNASVLLALWKQRDLGAAAAASAGRANRPAAPGDRPLAPQKSETVQKPQTEAAGNGEPGPAVNRPDVEGAESRASQRRQPTRRRRM